VSRVLVTGAGGFIGRHALAPLTGRELEVHAVSSRDREDEPGVRWHRADLLDPGAAAPLIDEVRPTHLLHFAWYAEHGKFWTSTENVRWVEASLRLLRAFAEAGGERAVLAGTCTEYEWGGEEPLSERSSAVRPATLYGSAKHGLHSVAAAYARERGIGLAWGRIFFLYGPGEHPDRLVASLTRAMIEGRAAPTSSGELVRDFLHVADVADAFVALLESDVDGAVNIASGQGAAIREVGERLGALTERPELLRVGELPPRPGDPQRVVADASRLRDEVGWAPRYDLDSGLRHTVEWWRSELAQAPAERP
jgi:nucleoside-diphosphate-sugar epimerase